MSDHKLSLGTVALKAGVSKATVSRVLSSADVRISPKTRARVQQIADTLGYSPNRAARALVTGCTQTLALWNINLRSGFSSQVIHFVNEEITRHNYDLMVATASSNNSDVLNTSHLLSWPIDGIFALDLPRAYIPGLHKGLLGGKPFVNMGGYVFEHADYVHVDLRGQVVEAVRHLDAVGCKRIAYLVPDWFDWYRECDDARLGGYEKVMLDIGKAPEFILTSNERRKAVAEPLKEYILRKGSPDGLFCYNDDMAIGAFRTLRDLGLRIPEDVALVGCDGIEDTSYFDPRISTIIQPLEQMCRIAWAFLDHRIKDNDMPIQQITVQPRFEIRGSSQR